MKQAIALIELVFAIVVIGITLLAVPNLLSLSRGTAQNAITQESVSSGASQAALVMSQYWDEVDTDPNYNSPVLYVKNGDSELNETTDSNGNLLGRRVGSNQNTPRRYEVDSNGSKLEASSTLGEESNDVEKDDIDDFDGDVYTLVHNNDKGDPTVGEFKDLNISIATIVNYIEDNNTYSQQDIVFNNPFKYPSSDPNSTNIKAISVTITSTNDPNKRIVLRAFSCNIGATRLDDRVFP